MALVEHLGLRVAYGALRPKARFGTVSRLCRRAPKRTKRPNKNAPKPALVASSLVNEQPPLLTGSTGAAEGTGMGAAEAAEGATGALDGVGAGVGAADADGAAEAEAVGVGTDAETQRK